MQLPKFWYLQELHIDERLPDDVFDAFEANARLERWGHHAEIFRARDDSDVSVVLKGRVWLQDIQRDDQIPLAHGDIFGRTHSDIDHDDLILRAHDDTLLAVLGRDDFRALVAPHLGRLQTRVGMFRKRRDLWVPVQPLLFTTPRSRLAKVLLHLIETEGHLDDDGFGHLGISLHPRKLAHLTGVDPQRVRRVLHALELDKIVEQGRAPTRVWDLNRLRRIAQGV